MERYRKKDLLQKVAALTEANEKIAGRKTEPELAGAIGELIQCQETAIQIGTYLEAAAGGYPFLVGLLEDYCETIYQMSISLEDANRRRKLFKSKHP